MRYFLCTFDCFSGALCIGVPEDSVAAIMTYPEEVTEIIKREEGGDTFFSLPHFFELDDRTIRHGIILKPLNQAALQEDEEGPRNILLVSAVEREIDISPEDIFPLPDLLAAPDRIPFFTGIWFTNSTMIAFIDPASLIARILKDAEGGPTA
ncbi:MAG: hypothetical protein LBQ38_06445 [Spirochaetaceae bacterium]|jgi:hypothetical protein|nr:hypothetical protein [Spirochaetaceae bacterium]